jgi:hypothetical protein
VSLKQPDLITVKQPLFSAHHQMNPEYRKHLPNLPDRANLVASAYILQIISVAFISITGQTEFIQE